MKKKNIKRRKPVSISPAMEEKVQEMLAATLIGNFIVKGLKVSQAGLKATKVDDDYSITILENNFKNDPDFVKLIFEIRAWQKDEKKGPRFAHGYLMSLLNQLEKFKIIEPLKD